jgi:branched-chain amino acid transport system ATP-binding protein
MLSVRNLMVFFENALALNDISIEVGERELVGVLGSNSAGKTTLMNTISGLILDIKEKEARRGGERVTIVGKVFFNGEDITQLEPDARVKRGIILARERHPIFPDSNVLENLRIAGYLRKGRDTRDILDYVFHLFPSLARMKGRKAGLLSGGEQQMLIIGMTLIAGPKLLLLDEPLLGLSPALQKDLMRAIVTIRKERGLTVLVTEQFARPLLPVIDRGYVIENGAPVFSGTRAELMDNPEVISAYFGM